MKVEITKKEDAYNGFFKLVKFTFKHQLFNGEMSKEITRELFERGNAVSILMHDNDRGVVVLVKQFRIGAIESDCPWIIELPAGMVEPGESVIDVAERESVEETGLAVTGVREICEYYSSVGGSSEKTTLVYANVDTTNLPEFAGLYSENEDIKVMVVGEDDFVKNCRAGLYNTASLIIAGLWLGSISTF